MCSIKIYFLLKNNYIILIRIKNLNNLFAIIVNSFQIVKDQQEVKFHNYELHLSV